MKKNFMLQGLMIAAIIALTPGCAKQEAPAEESVQPAKVGVPYELTVGIDTKTATTDAQIINWVASDALNVFIAEYGEGFSENINFATEDGSSTFTGNLPAILDAEKSYNWKVVYPYDENILTVNTHDGTKGYLTLGSKTNTTQSQAGNNSKAHLAGSHMPLYGVIEKVAGDEAPVVTLSQVMSVLKVNVTNANEDPLVVSTVDFTAPEGTLITGTFFLDFSGEIPVFTSSGATYTSNVAKLTVVGGAAIEKGHSAEFYIALLPFSANAGQQLKLSVNGYERAVTLPSNLTLTAGMIKTLNFTYDKAVPVANLPFAIDGTGGSSAYSTVDGLSASGLGSSDYAASNHSPYLTKFDTTGDYIQIHFNEPAGSVSFSVKKIGGAGNSTFVLSGSKDGAVFNNIETFSVTGVQNAVVDFSSSAYIDADYRYLRLTFTKSANVGFGPFSVKKPSTDPIIQVTSDNPMAVSNENDIYAIEYSIINPVGGKSISAATDVDWITDFDYTTAGEVAFEVAAQADGAPARSGNITLSYDGADDVIVVINQEKGANLSGVYSCTFNSKSWGVTPGADFSWTSGKDGGGYSNNGIQVTTAATGANGTTTESFTSVSKVIVTYNTNKSAGAGSLELQIGTNSAHSESVGYSGSSDGRTASFTCTFDIATPESGQIKLTVKTTTNSIYVVGVEVTASGIAD